MFEFVLVDDGVIALFFEIFGHGSGKVDSAMTGKQEGGKHGYEQ